MSLDDPTITPLRIERARVAQRHEILSVYADDTVAAVCRQFERKRTGIGIVVDYEDHVIGVISPSDVVHAVGEHGANALYLPVRAIMATEVVTCAPDEPAENAIQRMTIHHIRHLPVVENGFLRGCVEKMDALETLHEKGELDFAQLCSHLFRAGDPH